MAPCKRRFQTKTSDAIKQKKRPQKLVDKDDSVLPNPYGEDSTYGRIGESALSRRVRKRDFRRQLWTKICTVYGAPTVRSILAGIAFTYSILLFFGWDFAIDQAGMAMFVVLSVFYFPPLLASTYAHMSARDRLQLKSDGKRSMEAHPGVEGILNSLKERVLRERTRLLCAVVAALSINSVGSFETGTVLASILYGLAIFLGAIALWFTLQLEQSIPMTEDDFPLLSLHAPTLHQSTLDRVLSDLLVAHLDPETAGEWDKWVQGLEEKVRFNQTPGSAVEHLLRVLHLNHLGLLGNERLLSESKRVFRVSAIDELTDDTSKFSLKALRRLMAHTRAWQPGMFRLIDRLQDSAMRGHASLIENSWRMDLDIPPRCSQGQGNLFVMIHNHSREPSQIEIEIIAADGEPHLQTLRVNPPLSKQPKRPAKLGEEGNDLVDVLGRLIDNCFVLWIGLAWPVGTSGSRPVQVTLRGPLGETLSSVVVTTSLSTRFNPEGAAEKMLDAAVAVRRLATSVAE